MKSLVVKMLMICLTLGLYSCQNELPTSEEQNLVKNNIENFSLHVIYDNKDFYSQCLLLDDSLVIENKDLEVLIKEIYENNEIVQTYVHQDGSVEYLTNEDCVLEDVDQTVSKKDNILYSKSGYYDQFDGYALMWMDPDYSGLMIDAVNMYKKIPQNFNIPALYKGKISSIEIYLNYENLILGQNVASVLICYDKLNCRGNSLTLSCLYRSNPYRIPDLRKFPIGSSSWNDRILSVSFSVKDPFK